MRAIIVSLCLGGALLLAGCAQQQPDAYPTNVAQPSCSNCDGQVRAWPLPTEHGGSVLRHLCPLA